VGELGSRCSCREADDRERFRGTTVFRVGAVSARDQGFTPEDLGFIADPSPTYRQLRERHPLLYDEATDHWLITRYGDVAALLRDRRWGRTYRYVASDEATGRTPPDPALEPFWQLVENGILDMEPPDHTRVRRLVSKAFSPKMVAAMVQPIQRLMDGLLDRVQGTGAFDLIPSLAEPLPVAVIASCWAYPNQIARTCARGRSTSAACMSCNPPRTTNGSPCVPPWRSPTTCARSRASAGASNRRPDQRDGVGRG
jgi:cytochrome P450